MKKGSSLSWRQGGGSEAFDDGAREYKARQFESTAKFLLKSFDAQISAPSFEAIMLLPTAEFLLSLALELLAKAYYLKANVGPQEAIYRHDVAGLLDPTFLTYEQHRLMRHAERYVVWAGRYPTPKWTKEIFKEDYDVPSAVQGHIEHISASDIPNTASRPRCEELLALYERIHTAWSEHKPNHEVADGLCYAPPLRPDTDR